MVDLDKAVSYVQSNGDTIECARLAAILWDEAPPETVFQALAKLQKADGGFAYWCRPVSNMCDTAYVLQWFDDLKVFSHPMADTACRFLIDHQQVDGGWDEVEGVQGLDVPEWMIPGRLETRVWLTAFCAHVLIRFGYAEAPGTRCPTDFLLAHCDDTGRMTGYLRATWLALPMLAFYPGAGPEAYQRAVAVVERDYSDDWSGAYLAWLLRCLKDAGLPADHPLVTRSLADLERRQRLDGSWGPEPGEGEAQGKEADDGNPSWTYCSVRHTSLLVGLTAP
jgi:hypothetical protein